MSIRRPYRRGAPAPAYVARAPIPQAKPSPAAQPVPLRKPVFTTVDKLLPQTRGHTLTARVLTAHTVLEKGAAASPHLRRTRVAECLVGDHTGTVLFTARNEQIDLVKPGTTVIFRNAKIDMFKGTMRLAVDKWGRIEVTEPASFQVKEDNNVSVVEYELVDVSREED